MLVPRIANDQHGVFTRRQARAEGYSAKVIARRLAAGVWNELVPDVFCAVGTPRSLHVRAQAGTLATNGAASHGTAAELLGLDVADLAGTATSVHVTMPRRIHAVVPQVVEHRLPLAADETTTVDGIRCTDRRRTVVDLLAYLDDDRAATLFFRAVQRKWLFAVWLDEAIAARRGMHGTPRLRSLRELMGTNAHSVAESALHKLLGGLGGAGAAWRANVPIALADRRVVVDILFPAAGIVVELDGQRFHSGADEFQSDRDRQNALVLAGYVVLRFTWFDVTRRPEYVLDTIEHNLRSSKRR